MSVNINVTVSLPFDLIAAIKDRGNNQSDIPNLNAALMGTKQAVFKAVDAIPYNISLPVQSAPSQRSAGPPSVPWTIYVKTLQGNTDRVAVFSHTTVNELAKEIEKVGGVPPSIQRLIFAGTTLQHSHCDDEDEEDADGSRTLAEYGIVSGSTIHLVLRLTGS